MEITKTPWYKYIDENERHLKYPNNSIYDFIKESANKYKDNVALNYFGKKITYKSLINNIEICAKSLKQMGVKAKDSISICMPNTPEAIYLFYAINKLGAICNMIHPLSAENEILHYLNVSNSKFIFAIDISFNKIKNIINKSNVEKVILISVKESMPSHTKIGYYFTKGRKIDIDYNDDLLLSWKDFINKSDKCSSYTNAHLSGKEPAVILYSGGTTGTPKGILLSNLNFNALAIQSFVACKTINSESNVLSIMPIFHGFGLGVCIHTVLYAGATAIILPQFSAATFDKLLKNYKPNIIVGVPSLYEAIMKNKHLKNTDLSFIKCAISGGDSLSIELKKKIDKFLLDHNANIQVREGYGLTECVTGSCLTPINKYKEGCIGIPYSDMYYKIVKPNTTEELPYGEIGEIVISGPTVMLEYVNEPEETANVLKMHNDGKLYLHTGDLGCMDEDGFIYFKQRLKRIIITNGYNVYPQYIENIIDSCDEVLTSTVIGIDHPYKGQVAKAFVVLKNNIEPSNYIKDKIMNKCKLNLAKYSLPVNIEFREELPKTLVGKVAYNKLIEEETRKNG